VDVERVGGVWKSDLERMCRVEVSVLACGTLVLLGGLDMIEGGLSDKRSARRRDLFLEVLRMMYRICWMICEDVGVRSRAQLS
jgi:hypothetical protein